jgi:hypothetical protein
MDGGAYHPDKKHHTDANFERLKVLKSFTFLGMAWFLGEFAELEQVRKGISSVLLKDSKLWFMVAGIEEAWKKMRGCEMRRCAREHSCWQL